MQVLLGGAGDDRACDCDRPYCGHCGGRACGPLSKTAFSKKQWRTAWKRRCKACTESQQPPRRAVPRAPEMHHTPCEKCARWLIKETNFNASQKSNPSGLRTCLCCSTPVKLCTGGACCTYVGATESERVARVPSH